MLAYRTPGVYFEWLDLAPHALAAVRTDIASFVGIAARGPLHRAVRVESWTQFTSIFGAPVPQGYLAPAVAGFFAAGGRTCWIVRVADPLFARCAGLDIRDRRNARTLRLTAASEGQWARQLAVRIARNGGDRFTLTLRLPDGTQEQWRDLSLDRSDGRFVEKILNPDWIADQDDDLPVAAPPWIDTPDGGPPVATTSAGLGVRRPAGGGAASLLVRAAVLAGAAPGAQTALDLDALPRIGYLAGGADGLWSLAPEHLSGRGAPVDKRWGLAAFELAPEIGIVAMPDIMPKPVPPAPRHKWAPPRCDLLDQEPQPDIPEIEPEFPPAFSAVQIRALQQDLVAHCEALKNRVAILDCWPATADPEAVLAWRQNFDTSYAALYYPWLRVEDTQQPGGPPRDVPPSGHLAGVYARVEALVGPHKPPANEVLDAALDVTVAVDDLIHGRLNDGQVNVLRAYAGRGLRVAGARTLSSESEWRYVNVRRLMLMIERSLEAGTQWLVFEPNNPALWRDFERVLRGFLDDLWRRGMLDGATAAQAYSVACDISTNPPAETGAGRLIAVIGVQPPWPAEFVVARIGKTENGIQVMEGRGA
jgi:phage tail sheath protein FI